MTPLWAFEGEVIFNFANFKEDGLVTLEGGEGEREGGEKGILKINWTPIICVKGKSVDHYIFLDIIITYVE